MHLALPLHALALCGLIFVFMRLMDSSFCAVLLHVRGELPSTVGVLQALIVALCAVVYWALDWSARHPHPFLLADNRCVLCDDRECIGMIANHNDDDSDTTHSTFGVACSRSK